MKYIIVILLFLILIYKSALHTKQHESFYYVKVLSYFFVSLLHSVIIYIPIPFGCIMAIISYSYALKNKAIKKIAIVLGILTFLITALPAAVFIKPMQYTYLFLTSNDTYQIDIYAKNVQGEEYPYAQITNADEIRELIFLLQKAEPEPTLSYRYRPSGNIFRLHCSLNTMSRDFYVLKTAAGDEYLYIGDLWIPYISNGVFDKIRSFTGTYPSSMEIIDMDGNIAVISDYALLKQLWDRVPFLSQQINKEIQMQLEFNLYFPDGTIHTGKIDNFCTQILWENKTFVLPPYLQSQLANQYILNQLHKETFELFNKDQNLPIPIQANDYLFIIQPIPNTAHNGVYRIHKQTDTSELLTTLEATVSSMELASSDYLLIYEKLDDQLGNIMSIKTKEPYPKRYIVSKQKIIPESCFTISPAKDKFAYLVSTDKYTSIQLIENVFRDPKTIYQGNIQQVIWISSTHLAFTEIRNHQTYLYILNVENQFRSQIRIDHSVDLLSSTEDKLTIRVYKHQGDIYLYGIYELSLNMNIQKLE